MSVNSQQEAYRNIEFYLAAVKDVARADGNRTREIGAESLLESLEMLKPTESNEPYPNREALASHLSTVRWGNAATRIDARQFWLGRADAILALINNDL